MTERQLVERLLRIERAERDFTRKNRLMTYNTGARVHAKQLDFHRCTKRNRWVFGGNRSGKTECGAAEAVWLARGNHPYKENRRDVCGWVVSPSCRVQRDVAQAKILAYLNPDWIESVVMVSGSATAPQNGVIDFISVRNVFGGISRIGFKSCEMGRDKFQGASLFCPNGERGVKLGCNFGRAAAIA